MKLQLNSSPLRQNTLKPCLRMKYYSPTIVPRLSPALFLSWNLIMEDFSSIRGRRDLARFSCINTILRRDNASYLQPWLLCTIQAQGVICTSSKQSGMAPDNTLTTIRNVDSSDRKQRDADSGLHTMLLADLITRLDKIPCYYPRHLVVWNVFQ